jgi:protein TonB
MFTDNVWDPWANASRRGWATLISFTLQAMGIALLLLAPLIYTGGVPHMDLHRPDFIPLPPVGSQASPPSRASAAADSNYSHGILVVPPSIPAHVAVVDDHGSAPVTSDPGIGVPFGTGLVGRNNAVINSIGDTAQAFVPKPPPAVARPPRVSAMMEGYLIHKVEPVYPVLARAARIQGAVELQAVISKDGHIERLLVLRGHPMLVKAAVEAVQQWRYRPYVLNGEPVEVETHVTVNFSLMGG